MTEIIRLKNRFLKGSETLYCLNCGKELILEYNGGELDSRECCGYTYSAEHRQVDIVVSKNLRAGQFDHHINPENWFNSRCPKCTAGQLVAHPPENPIYTHFCIGDGCGYQRPKVI